MPTNLANFSCLCLFVTLLSGCAGTEPAKLRGCYGIEDFYQNNSEDNSFDGLSIQLQESSNWIGKYSFDNGENGKFVKFWFEKDAVNADGTDRARVQLNMYSLAQVKDFYLHNSFSLSSSLSNFTDEQLEFEWLNLFELWIQPGWSDYEHPAKVHFRIVKNRGESYFTPVISAQYKDNEKGKWITKWERGLDLQVLPSKDYELKLFLSVDPIQTITVSLLDKESNNAFGLNITDEFTHPDYNQPDPVFWGVNPIKLYTGENLLNRFEESGVQLSVTYKDFSFCAL